MRQQRDIGIERKGELVYRYLKHMFECPIAVSVSASRSADKFHH